MVDLNFYTCTYSLHLQYSPFFVRVSNEYYVENEERKKGSETPLKSSV